MGKRRAGPCVLRRARSARLLRMRKSGATNIISLILSKRSASKDGQATGRAVRPSTRSLRSLAQDEEKRSDEYHQPHPEQAKRVEGWASDGPGRASFDALAPLACSG